MEIFDGIASCAPESHIICLPLFVHILSWKKILQKLVDKVPGKRPSKHRKIKSLYLFTGLRNEATIPEWPNEVERECAPAGFHKPRPVISEKKRMEKRS